MSGSSVFRPLGSVFLSILFHGTLVLIFIGYLTASNPVTGVLPPAIPIQIGHYQLEQQQEAEINHAPKQQMATREETLPHPVKEIENLPKTRLVENGNLAHVSEKKQPPKQRTEPAQKRVMEAPKNIQEEAITAVPASGNTANNSATFTSNASVAVSGQQSWYSEVHQRLGKAKRYPREALRYNSTGISQVKVVLDSHGELVSVSLETSSGTKILDKEALATINRAAPFPAPPETLLIDGKVEFIAPIAFDLATL
jgi:protein TonB